MSSVQTIVGYIGLRCLRRCQLDTAERKGKLVRVLVIWLKAKAKTCKLCQHDPISQQEEDVELKSIQCEFESRLGHHCMGM